jgi:hypothetical protein
MSYLDQETKVNLLAGCFSSLEYKPHVYVQQYDTFKYMYIDILELRDTIEYNGQLLVAVLGEQLKDYIKENMIYNNNWPSYYIKLYKGNSPDSFKIVVKYNQIIGSRFIGEYPINELLQLIDGV